MMASWMEAAMATMVVEVYDALRSIGVAEDKATKAAEAMATLEPQFALMRSDLRVLKWQVGLLFAVTGPTLLLLLRVAAKVGAFG
jgi:hypothetical protein